MIYYLTLLVFFFLNNAIFVHVVTAALYSHVIMAAISEAFPDITRLPYNLYIPSSLLNSLLDNNIMYKSTEHCLNQTCFSHRNTGFVGEKKQN